MQNEWDTIKSMHATFTGGPTYQGEQAWAALVAFRAPYKGVPKMPALLPRMPRMRKPKGYKGAPQLKQIPSTKENYRTKNAIGGRKATFTQSREYKLKDWTSCATPWYGWKQ